MLFKKFFYVKISNNATHDDYQRLLNGNGVLESLKQSIARNMTYNAESSRSNDSKVYIYAKADEPKAHKLLSDLSRRNLSTYHRLATLHVIAGWR